MSGPPAYDPFGNITKSVPPSMTGIAWQPGYNSNNQYTLGGTSYDGNGNLTADTFNTYTWDSDANTVGVNLSGSAPITVTYDAFDRAVEENNSGTYKQILYSPISKLALLAKQSATNVFLPLPGGEQATYTHSTIRFRHYDWLGSARFESNMSEQEYGDVAYAPFGETYAIKNTPYLSFTGQQPDTVSGTYDFLYRKYNPVQGRWISPDSAGLGAVRLANPQSWNRYAYVMNAPLNSVDPSGLAARIGDGFGDWNIAFCAGNGCYPGTSFCTIDGGGNIPCESGLLGSRDSSVVCPQCKPGQGVGIDNKIYQYQWVDPYVLTTGSVDQLCDPAKGPCSSDVDIAKIPGHFDLVSVGQIQGADSSAANNGQFDQTRRDLEALSELEVLGSRIFSKYTQRALVSSAMVFSGGMVAYGGVLGTIGVCATGVGCLASPITGGVALAGGGLALEGVYYGVTGTFWNPVTGKSCGANGCN